MLTGGPGSPGPGASREQGQSRPEAWAHSAYSLQSKGGHPVEGRPAREGPQGDSPRVTSQRETGSVVGWVGGAAGGGARGGAGLLNPAGQ